MQLLNFVLDKTGGDWAVNGDLILGAKAGATATFTQNSGTVTVKNNKWTKSTNGNGILNLNGGTFVTRHIEDETAGGSLTVNINGGTLKANSVLSSGWITHGSGAGLNVNVGADGATIDTDGLDLPIHVAVNAVSGTTGSLTVTGGGSVTFSAQGNLAGALAVGDGTTLHWFDQDAAVSATCGFTSLALGAGATIYIDGDATGVDALPATVTTTATSESKANIVINFSAIPATGASFALLPATSVDVFNVSPMFGSLVLPHEVAVAEGNLVLTIVAEDYTWNGTGTNWGDADAWTKGGASATWADGNNAIFNTANATATLAANASPAKIAFSADATVDGSASLTVPVVSVASGVTATISAPTADVLEKTGAGTLVLGSSRTAQTTVSEGTLKMASGATVDPAKLKLGSDSSAPVTFDYGGQTLSGNWAGYLESGMDITLTNGTFSTAQNPGWSYSTCPKTLTIAKDAVMTTSERFTWNVSTTAGADVSNCVNIVGGSLISTKDNNNWFVQNSRSGTLTFNVSDGGLLELSGHTYVLPCRDNTTASDTPSVLMTFNDSTFRVKGKNLFLGHDDGSNARQNPLEPVFELAMTNSTLDVGTGNIKLGHNVVQSNHGGHATADFENCVITAKQFAVYFDRPANAARFNNSTIVISSASESSIEAQADCDEQPGEEWAGRTPIAVDAGGLVIDTQNFSCHMQADPQGAGAITKTGSGILHFRRNQTSSSPLVCEGGETYVFDGLSVARAVTVKSGAKFTTKGTGQVTLASLALEDGAELRVDEYRSGITPMAITTSLILPASGTVTLTKNNDFSQGKYRILEKAGITVADVQDRLVPATTGELAHSWSVEGNTLFLTVGNPSAFAWTGLAGDGKMSTPGNWLGNVAPGAGDPADFSTVNMAMTVEADIDATLGAVTMGDAIVTFTGALTATSISDTLKVMVGADSTVTIDGDLMFEGAGSKYAVYKVDAGGRFVVTGKLGKAAGSTCTLSPQQSPGTGIIVPGSLVNDGSTGNINAALDNNATTQKWAIGPGGITGTASASDTYGIWVYSNNKVNPEFQPYTNDFTVSLWTCLRENAKSLTYNTTGLDGNGYTITLDGGFSDKTAPLYVTGSGKVVVNHVTKSFGTKDAYSGPVTVKDTATLAINAGKKLTSGTITFAAGTTLEVPSTGVATSAIAFSGEGTVTLKVADATLADGDYTLLTSTADLPSDVATKFVVELPEENPLSPRPRLLYTPDNRVLKLLVGDVTPAESIWIGTAGDGKMSTAGNWVGGVPSTGADVRIPSTTAAINNDIDGFAPASITFGYGPGAVTISGNPITGVAAITNLSTTASHTIDAPVHFAGDIQVKQAAMAETGDLTKAHVTFAGGAYAAPGYALENGNFAAVYSRCMFGKYYLATDVSSPWTATVQGSGKRHCLADDSTLYIPYAGRLTELYVGNGAKVDVGGMAMGDGGGRVSYRNNGEMAVTNLTLAGKTDRYMSYNQGITVSPVFKFERIETSMTVNWCYFSDGNAASKGVYYIGAGGVNFSSASASGSYCIGRDVANDAQTIRPWYSDFTIGDRGNNAACFVMSRDVTFCTDDESGTGRTITMDAIARGYGSAPTITVSGSGTLRVNKAAINTTQPPVAVTNTATLAIKPGANLTTSAMTLNSGTTLQVAESGTVALGGDLSLKAGAKLGFNYTTRDAPVLDLTSKTVTFDEGETTNVVVKISSTDGKRGRGGVYALTVGGKFADATVTLAEGYPDWVKGISVVDGEIVIDVKSKGTYIIVK